MIRPAAVAFCAFVLRLWLILQYPIIFGADSMVRLVHRDQILLAHNLLLLQLLIWTVSRFSGALIPVRILMALIGAAAAAGFYFLAEDFAGPRAAVWAGLLFATHPFITPVSIVPYQEILFWPPSSLPSTVAFTGAGRGPVPGWGWPA
jgi:hypothetical protein